MLMHAVQVCGFLWFVKLQTANTTVSFEARSREREFSEDQKPGAAPGIGASRHVCLAFLSDSSNSLSDSFLPLLAMLPTRRPPERLSLHAGTHDESSSLLG